MTTYHNLKDKPERFHALTGYTLEEFAELFPYFLDLWTDYVQTHTLMGKPRKKRRWTHYKNSSFASTEDMLLFILIYLRKAPTQDVFGELFNMSQPLANRWIHLLGPILNQALSKLGELPSRETEPTPKCASSEVSTQSQEVEYFFS